MELETYDRDKPTAYYDDIPTVQIPLSADRAGLAVDGEFMSLFELPDKAAEAYMKYAEQGGNVRIYQCDNCGYLTASDAFSATTYNQAYECGGCGSRLKGTTQNRSTESATQVHGPYVDRDDEQHVDVLAVEAIDNCPMRDDHGPLHVETDHEYDSGVTVTRSELNDDAVECRLCVPNHPSHLGRLQNEVGGEITQSEMMHTAAVAIKEFREA